MFLFNLEPSKTTSTYWPLARGLQSRHLSNVVNRVDDTSQELALQRVHILGIRGKGGFQGKLDRAPQAAVQNWLAPRQLVLLRPTILELRQRLRCFLLRHGRSGQTSGLSP